MPPLNSEEPAGVERRSSSSGDSVGQMDASENASGAAASGAEAQSPGAAGRRVSSPPTRHTHAAQPSSQQQASHDRSGATQQTVEYGSASSSAEAVELDAMLGSSVRDIAAVIAATTRSPATRALSPTAEATAAETVGDDDERVANDVEHMKQASAVEHTQASAQAVDAAAAEQASAASELRAEAEGAGDMSASDVSDQIHGSTKKGVPDSGLRKLLGEAADRVSASVTSETQVEAVVEERAEVAAQEELFQESPVAGPASPVWRSLSLDVRDIAEAIARESGADPAKRFSAGWEAAPHSPPLLSPSPMLRTSVRDIAFDIACETFASQRQATEAAEAAAAEADRARRERLRQEANNHPRAVQQPVWRSQTHLASPSEPQPLPEPGRPEKKEAEAERWCDSTRSGVFDSLNSAAAEMFRAKAFELDDSPPSTAEEEDTKHPPVRPNTSGDPRPCSSQPPASRGSQGGWSSLFGSWRPASAQSARGGGSRHSSRTRRSPAAAGEWAEWEELGAASHSSPVRLPSQPPQRATTQAAAATEEHVDWTQEFGLRQDSRGAESRNVKRWHAAAAAAAAVAAAAWEVVAAVSRPSTAPSKDEYEKPPTRPPSSTQVRSQTWFREPLLPPDDVTVVVPRASRAVHRVSPASNLRLPARLSSAAGVSSSARVSAATDTPLWSPSPVATDEAAAVRARAREAQACTTAAAQAKQADSVSTELRSATWQIGQPHAEATRPWSAPMGGHAQWERSSGLPLVLESDLTVEDLVAEGMPPPRVAMMEGTEPTASRAGTAAEIGVGLRERCDSRPSTAYWDPLLAARALSTPDEVERASIGAHTAAAPSPASPSSSSWSPTGLRRPVSMEAMRSLLTSGARRVREYVWEDTVGKYRPVFVWIMCVLQTTVFAYSLFANDCPAYADERNAATAALNITQMDGGEGADGTRRCLGAAVLGPAAFEATSVNPLFGPRPETLLMLGAKSTWRIVERLEVWRLLAAVFLHGGLLHLLGNVTAILAYGSSLERDHGHVKVMVLFVLTGVFSMVSSAIFLPHQLTVGASGAAMGMLGCQWANLIMNWSVLDAPARQVPVLMLTVATEAFIGLAPYVDNTSHMAGFVAGLLLGFQQFYHRRVQQERDATPLGGTIRTRTQAQPLHQYVLMAVAAPALGLVLLVSVVMLFSGVDVATACPGCHVVNCVDTFLWSCNNVMKDEGPRECSSSWWEVNRTTFVGCPGGVPPPLMVVGEAVSDRMLQLLCTEHCD